MNCVKVSLRTEFESISGWESLMQRGSLFQIVGSSNYKVFAIFGRETFVVKQELISPMQSAALSIYM